MKSILPLFFLGISPFMLSQIKEENLILQKKREPEVKKIDKKKTSIATIKNYPPEEKSKINVDYKIVNIPAVSDFKTSTIEGEDIAPKIAKERQNNYFQLGLGNYGRILADGHIAYHLQKNLEVGADAHFLSTKGLTKEYPWSSQQNNAKVAAFVNAYGEKGKLNLDLNYGLDQYNFYGIYALEPRADIDLKQKINQINLNGYYDFYANEILNDIRVQSSFLKDHYNAEENAVSLEANLSKHAIKLKHDLSLNADLGLSLASVQSQFSVLEKNSSTVLMPSVAPKITIFKKNNYLKIGAKLTSLSADYSSTNNSLSEKSNQLFWFPEAEFQLAPTQEFKFFGGIDGNLAMNTYAQLLSQNPFLAPDQVLRPTQTQFHFYVGMRGDVDQTIKYDVAAGYSKIKNIQFFVANSTFDTQNTLERSAYNFANTFSSHYQDGTLSELKASLQFFPLANLSLDAEAHFKKYTLENQDYIYNIPLLAGSLGAKYLLLDKKLSVGFKGIFSTDRTTNSFEIARPSLETQPLVSNENKEDKVGGFLDLNLSAEYQFHKNFSIFAIGNNLLNTKYQTFTGYKVLGAQVLGGLKITF